jgi:hypothetical protein
MSHVIHWIRRRHILKTLYSIINITHDGHCTHKMPCSVLDKDSKKFNEVNEEIGDTSRDVGAGWV